jgi:phage tail sheath protein FI
MPTNYRTPDVYVEEIPTLPPSIAEVSTAIPAFIGYTEKAVKDPADATRIIPVRISSMLEYTSYFGGPDKVSVTVEVVDVGVNNEKKYVVDSTKTTVSALDNKLYYCLDHFFKNGGSNCYILSIGTYDERKSDSTKAKSSFLEGLNAIRQEDEPTLLMLSEATTLGAPDYYKVCQAALTQCADLMDRFCIFDVLPTDANGQEFKSDKGVGMQNLKYGAAYYPYLNTSLNYLYNDIDVTVSGLPDTSTPSDTTTTDKTPASVRYTLDLGGVRVSYNGVVGDAPTVEVIEGENKKKLTATVTEKKLSITNVGAEGKPGTDVADAFDKLNNKGNFTIEKIDDGTSTVNATTETALKAGTPAQSARALTTQGKTLDDIKKLYTALYNSIKLEINKFRVVLPPSPAVAGVYSTVDRERGVWKAPANVSLNAVISPVIKITANDQDQLNIDETGGKSINAIRSFTGKGTLIWGARTLAGNDNEWRYISVRRLFNMIEESAKKASYFAVFEPNNPTTWLKVRGMIESYLYGLWQQGALAGSTTQAAYYVNVGLGTTMTQQDILEGRMIIEIGIAAVRPAEFIVLKFSHKLQEA